METQKFDNTLSLVVNTHKIKIVADAIPLEGAKHQLSGPACRCRETGSISLLEQVTITIILKPRPTSWFNLNE